MCKCNHSYFDHEVVTGKKVAVKTGGIPLLCHCEKCGRMVWKGKKTKNKAFGS